MEEKEIKIVKESIKKFILKLRLNPAKSDIVNILFTYYVKDPAQIGRDKNKPKIDCEGISKRLSEDILLSKDSIWGIKESDAKLVKDYIQKFDISSLKEFIEECLNINLEDEAKKILIEEQKKNTEEQDFILKICNSDELIAKAVDCIIKDNRELPYKNNKIGAMCDLGLHQEQIYLLMNKYENLSVAKGYIEKIKTEKQSTFDKSKIKDIANKLIKNYK